jgi:Pyruvate/2-oxoacid:ferredoxin oxidoreductase gamma subunit
MGVGHTRDTYLTDAAGPLPFCPGCGHRLLVGALDAALTARALDPREVVLVTDIGCIGLSDRHFVTSAVHGLHGRAVTYACGIKLARPELTVVALVGDGGCGIGAGHLLGAARRNIGVLVVVANNFNFGMTGGQPSVTACAAAASQGVSEAPLDVCSAVTAAAASWVYRTTVFERDLPAALAEGLAAPGFALLDVWEPCAAYRALSAEDLKGLMDRYGMRPGLLRNEPRAEFSAAYREAIGVAPVPRRPVPIQARYENAAAKRTEFIVSGRAGQKVRSAATSFAAAGMLSGLDASQRDDLPVTVKSGCCTAEVVLSPEPIGYTGADVPDYVVVVSPEGLDRVRGMLPHLAPTAVVYCDATLAVPATPAAVRSLSFGEEARRAGTPPAPALVALAAMLHETGLFPVEALEQAAAALGDPAIAAASAKAVAAGARLGVRT